MPALPSVPAVIRVEVTGDCAGIPVATVFHLGYSGPPPSGENMQLLARSVSNGWGANITPLQCNVVDTNTFVVTDLSSQTGSSAIQEATHIGSAAGVAVSNQAQMVLSKAIGRRYRGGHPHTYIYGLPFSHLLSPTHWDDAFAISVANAWGSFINSIVIDNTLGWITREVVVHYIKDHVELPAPLVDATAGAIARTLVGTLRRRLT